MSYPDTIIMEIPTKVAIEVGTIAARAIRDRARNDRDILDWLDRLNEACRDAADAMDGVDPWPWPDADYEPVESDPDGPVEQR